MSQQNYGSAMAYVRPSSGARAGSRVGSRTQQGTSKEMLMGRVAPGAGAPAQTISNEPVRRRESPLKRRVLDELRVLIEGEMGIEEIFISPSGERFWLVGPVWTDELDLLGARIAVQVQESVAPSRIPLILGGFVETVDPSFSSFERISNKP